MNRPLQSGRALAALGAALGAVFVTTAASAQIDGPRFRGGVGFEGGVLVAPNGGSNGTIPFAGSTGLHGQAGIQINDLWAIYALPSLSVFFGGEVLTFGTAVMAEITLPGAPLSIAAGPELVTLLAPTGDDPPRNLGMYGGRLRLAVHPVSTRSSCGPRRHAFSLGVDLRVMTGNFDSAESATLVVWPTAWIGYTAF